MPSAPGTTRQLECESANSKSQHCCFNYWCMWNKIIGQACCKRKMATNVLPCSKSHPSSINVSIQILLCWLPRTCTISRIVIGEYVAINPWTQSYIKAAHLTQVNSISVWEEQSVLGIRWATHKHTGNPVAFTSSSHEALNGIFFSRRILPVCSLWEM